MNIKTMMAAAKDFRRKPGYELKFYPAPGGKKAPFALLAPGGGYRVVCSFVEGEPFARALNERGYSAFVLYYRVDKQAKHPAPLDDMARGLREILENAEAYNVDPEGFSVWGASAGGHLTACFGTESLGYVHYGLPKPAALVLSYPVITMMEKAHSGSRDYLLGKNPTQEEKEALSVEKLVTGQYPPTYIWNTATDELVPDANSKLFAAAAEAAGIPCQYHCYPEGKHGQGLAIGTPCESWFDEAVRFWETHR